MADTTAAARSHRRHTGTGNSAQHAAEWTSGIFFHPPDERNAAREQRIAEPKRSARRCPAIAACLDHALRVREPYGIWGGQSEDERAALLGVAIPAIPRSSPGNPPGRGTGTAVKLPGQGCAVIAGTGPDPLPRSVIGRMLAILGSFSPDQPRLTLTQISQLCGLPVTTTHRLLSQAQEWGAVIRDADQHYWIGPRIVELAALAPAATTFSRRRRHDRDGHLDRHHGSTRLGGGPG